ncbi:hypothetical protein DMENIID0001_059600 [Sergentomyia squamirostris]
MKLLRRYLVDLEERMQNMEMWISIQNKELEEYRQRERQRRQTGQGGPLYSKGTVHVTTSAPEEDKMEGAVLASPQEAQISYKI